MPTYQLTSPKTGRVYNVDATAELPDDDIDALVNDLDFEAAREAGVQPGVDPAVLQQGPVGSFLQSIPQTFSKVGSGMIGGAGRILDKASESLSQATGLPKGGDMFQRMADYGDELSTSADLTFPTNPQNPVAGTIGSGAAQGLSLLAGGLAGKALTGSNVAMTAVPAASGFLSGANQGIQTAEQIGVQSPLAQLGTGMAFGGLEVLTERLGGIGSKAGTEALTRAVRQTAGQMLRSSGRAVGSEALEEVLAGRSQAALTRLIASEDPNNPGFTRTGVKLDDLASEIVNLEAMKLEALGGAAGGTVFAGVQALANRQLPNDPTTSPNQTPTAPQPPAPGQPGAPAPMAPGAPGPAAVSPLIGIAQRGGAVDVTLPEDTGELTAEEVADLETGRLGDLETGRQTPVAGAIRPEPGPSRVTDEGSIPSTAPLTAALEVSIDEAVRTGRPFTPEEQAFMLGQPAPRPAAQGPAPFPTLDANATLEASINEAVRTGRPFTPEEQAFMLGQPPPAANPDPAQTITGSNVQTGTEMPVPPPTAEAGAGAGAVGQAQPVDVSLELMTPKQVAALGVDLDVQEAQQRYEAARAANNPREGRLAEAAIAGAQAGTGRNAQRVRDGRLNAVDQAVAEGRPVNANALEDWARVPVMGAGFDATGNIPRRGIPAGYVRQGELYVVESSIQPPAASQEPAPTTETSGISLLRQLNAELPPAAQARWTPEVYAKSERYMQTGNEADLEGLTPIQRKRVINARIDADPDLRKAQEQWDRKMEHKASSIEKRDRAFEQKTTFKPKASEQSRDDAPGFQHLVIDRDLEAGFMSGAGADALIDLAHRAFAAGRTFSQWAAAMVQRFGAAVRDYLAGVWDHAKRSSQTGALNFTSRLGEQLQRASQQAASRLRNPASRATTAAMASDPGAAQNAEPSPGGLSEVRLERRDWLPPGVLLKIGAWTTVDAKGYQFGTFETKEEAEQRAARSSSKLSPKFDPDHFGIETQIGELKDARSWPTEAMAKKVYLQSHNLEEIKVWEAPSTKTASFAAKFGNSKVVDKNGDPLLVYHGTREFGFRKFFLYDDVDGDYGLKVISFTADRPKADYYARSGSVQRSNTGRGKTKNAPGIYEAYLVIERPLNMGLKLSDYSQDQAQAIANAAGEPFQQEWMNPITSPTVDRILRFEDGAHNLNVDALAVFDGIIEPDQNDYFVFSPNQIILAPRPESSRAAAGTSLPVSQSPRLEPPAATAPLKAAYASALRGSSTAMVPLADVFAAAQAANPALTQEQFQAQVMADYEAGSLMLEGAGGPQEAQSAGLRIDGTPVGTAVRMMVPQGFTHLDVSGQRSQAGFVINPLPALQRLAARVLPLHERGAPFRVQQLGARAILTGSPLPSDVTQVLAMTENERQAVAQSAAQVGRDLQAAVKAYLDRTGQDERATWDKINAVMEGQPGALTLLTAIDPALGERSRRARNMLDDLSAAVAQTLPTGSLRDAITQNQGSWMRRGYAAFDPESGWNFDGLTKAAKAGRQIGGKDAAKILANARAYLRSQNPQNGRTLKEWNADIEADMRDLMDRNAWQSANLGGNTLRKNVSSFMRRKEIAPEIRALMGEETNPLHRFIKSAAFQAQIVARHHGQTAVRALGLQTELFSTQRGGVYTEEIEPSENRWSGLAGVWTTPQMKAALANSSAVNREGTDLGGWLVGTVKALGNEAKLNRVALNPDSWVVNILGNVIGLVQSGDVFAWDFARRLTDARALIKSGKARPGSMQTAAESALIDAQRAMLARLRGMGVIGSSITLADIEASIPRHLLQWVAEDRARNTGLGAVKGAIMGQAAGRGLGLPGRVVGGVAGGIGGAIAGAQRLQNWQQNVADYVMTGPDALARVTGWLTNYETALAAGLNPDQAAADATTRTLNTFPNYNALPALLRQLSRLGFTGSFIAFQWEVYRNFGWNVKYAIEELSSGNAARQARGLRRLAGIGSVAALAGGGLAALLGAAGAAASDDEERNRIWRQWFAAPWEKDAVLAFDKYDKQGVSYYNTSYLLPQMTMMELIQGASEGRDPADSASRVLNRLSEQFIAGSVHLQPLLSAFANQDRFGRRITNAEGLAGAAARVDVALQTILEPGFADKITRLTYALRQAEKNGRKFSVEEEMKRLAGIRQVSRTWEELVKRRYSQFTYDYQGVRDDANKMLGQNLPGAPVRAVKMVNDKVIELEQQLADYERDLRRLGVPEPTIKAAKKDSNLQRLNPVRVRADGRRVEAVTVR